MKKRRLLLLLLLPPAAGCVWVASQDNPKLAALAALPAVGAFGLQALLLRLTRRRIQWLRVLPLALLLIPEALIGQTIMEGGWFWQLEAAFWLVVALFGVCGWGAAWGLSGLYDDE